MTGQKGSARLFTEVHRRRTRGSRHELKQESFTQARRRSFSPKRTGRQEKRLPGEAEEASPLEVIPSYLVI